VPVVLTQESALWHVHACIGTTFAAPLWSELGGEVWKGLGEQTYRCRECVHGFTPSAARRVYAEEVRRQALSMYVEGNGVEEKA
jgi:hypothetical protein